MAATTVGRGTKASPTVMAGAAALVVAAVVVGFSTTVSTPERAGSPLSAGAPAGASATGPHATLPGGAGGSPSHAGRSAATATGGSAATPTGGSPAAGAAAVGAATTTPAVATTTAVAHTPAAAPGPPAAIGAPQAWWDATVQADPGDGCTDCFGPVVSPSAGGPSSEFTGVVFAGGYAAQYQEHFLDGSTFAAAQAKALSLFPPDAAVTATDPVASDGWGCVFVQVQSASLGRYLQGTGQGDGAGTATLEFASYESDGSLQDDPTNTNAVLVSFPAQTPSDSSGC